MLLLLVSTMYKIKFGTDGASEFLYNGAQNVSVGPGFTQSAMDSVFSRFWFLFCCYCIIFLCLYNNTSLLLYAETNIST
jgi:AGCS family alanine or glycine:cation symporter